MDNNLNNTEKTVLDVTPATLFNPNPEDSREVTELKNGKNSSFQPANSLLYINIGRNKSSISTTQQTSLWAPQTLGTKSTHSRQHFDYTTLPTSHELSQPVSEDTRSLHSLTTPTHTLISTRKSEENSTLAMLLLNPVKAFAPSDAVKKATHKPAHSIEEKLPSAETLEILEAIRLGISKFGNLNSPGLKEMIDNLTAVKDTEKQKLINVKNTAEYHSSDVIQTPRFFCCYKEEPAVTKLQEFYQLVKNLDLRTITAKRIQRFKNQLVMLHETPFVLKKEEKKLSNKDNSLFMKR